MKQIHKRFMTEQVKVLLKGYSQGTLDRPAIEETLGISKTRFFYFLIQLGKLLRFEYGGTTE